MKLNCTVLNLDLGIYVCFYLFKSVISIRLGNLIVLFYLLIVDNFMFMSV